MPSIRENNELIKEAVNKCSVIIVSAQELITETTALKSELRAEIEQLNQKISLLESNANSE